MKQGILRKKGDWYQIEYKRGPNTKRTDLPRTFTDINPEWVDKEVLYETNENGMVKKMEYNGKYSEAVMSIPQASNVRIHIDNPKNIEVKEKEIKKDHITGKTNKFARAPYNFVPINNEVFFEGEITPFDKYEKDKKSGYISVSVSNLTPLFLRQISDKEGNFGYGGQYGIPGSSFRGMIRTMCEILSFGRFGRFDDISLYYRDSLTNKNEIFGGILEYKDGKYHVYSCKYKNVHRSWKNEIKPNFNEKSFEFTTGPFGSGNRNKFEFYDINTEVSYTIEQNCKVFKDYHSDKNRSEDTYNVFREARKRKFPIFYQLKENNICSIGFAKYHRIPFRKSIREHIDPNLLKSSSCDNKDLVQGLFGDSFGEGPNAKMLTSRLSFGDLLSSNAKVNDNISYLLKILSSPKPTTFQNYLEQGKNANKASKNWNSDAYIRGYKLYWHRKTENDCSLDLSWNECWDESKDNDVNPNTNREYKTKSHTTRIKPILEGANFKGKIWFQNLSDMELGLLITALEPGFEVEDNDKIAHKIGLGKPLGLGSITINVEDIQIFDTSNTGYFSAYEKTSDSTDKESLRNSFLTTLADKLGIPVDQIWTNNRLKELKTMLTWQDDEVGSDAWLKKTRYMEITRGGKTGKAGNEYDGRPILPRPTQYQSEHESNFVDKSSTNN